MKISSIVKIFSSINRHIYLALFVCLVVTITTPSLAQHNFVPTQTQLQVTRHSLLTQGRIAYQAGRYAEASNIWQQAKALYKTEGDNNNLALTLNYLSLSSQKQGNWREAEKYIDRSLELLQQKDLAANNLNLYAQALNNRGRLELNLGRAETALNTWEAATAIYDRAGDEIGKLGSQINQAQALQSLGLYRRAQKQLQQIAVSLESQSEPTLRIAGLRSLGIALQVTGDLNHAEEILQQSLAISQELNLTEESSNTLFALGNISRKIDKKEDAIALYQQATATTSQPLIKTEAQLNQLSLLIATEQWQEINALIRQIKTNLAAVSQTPSRQSIYAEINFAKNLINLSSFLNTANNPQELLTQAISQAKQLQDTKAESYALGILGHYYETKQQRVLGKEYTEKALILAQETEDRHLSYQWQWQLGRLLATEADNTSAISSYTAAVDSLQSLRSDLVVTNIDNQFSFRESVEPVYRELVSLLLQPQYEQEIPQQNLLQARKTIEALQLAELNNFFREACLDAKSTNVDNIDTHAAIIYPIILRDRLEIIVSLPGKALHHYSTTIPQTELEAEIERLRQTVATRSRRDYYQPAQNIYDWLIRPALQDLAGSKIKTLVFVPDGSFRNIPMAVLHDGKNYLIRDYNIALTPSLQLLAPQPVKRDKLKTLAAGLTEERQGFSPLDYVKVELEDIQAKLNSTILLNQEFTQENLQTKIESARYPVIHIATHGQFSSILEDTFLLTWNSRLQIDRLNSILQNQTLKQENEIELLVLSACETAVGDNRAALGLAGMAVRAGARSTLATLWSVNDRTTALTIDNFYQQLTKSQTPTSKTEALREAQLTLINSRQFDHPFYWAPFVLVGNWL